MNLPQSILNDVLAVFPDVEVFGVFNQNPCRAIWTHHVVGTPKLNLPRCRRLAKGFVFEQQDQGSVTPRVLEPLVDITHWASRSCYHLIQHPEDTSRFYLFCWTLSPDQTPVYFSKPYLARDILTCWQSES